MSSPQGASKRGARWVTACLLVCACTADPAHFTLGIPDQPDVRSEILIVRGAGQVDIYAYDVESGPLEIDVPLGSEVEALVYTETLAQLRISPGRHDGGTWPAPTPVGVFAAQLDLNETPAWTRRDATISQVFLRPPVERCPRYSSHTLDMPARVTAVAPIDDSSFLYFTASAIHRVDFPGADGTPISQREVTTRATSRRWTGALALSDGEFVLLDDFGELHTARLTDEVTLERESLGRIPDGPHRGLEGARVNGLLELYTQSNTGVAVRWNEGGSEIINEANDSHRPGRVLTRHGLGYVGPGEAFFAWCGRNDVLTYDSAGDRLEPVAMAGLTAAEYVPRMGRVVGDSEGAIYVDTGDEWQRFKEGTFFVQAIAPFRDGLLYGGPLGSLFEVEAGEQCPLLLAHGVAEIAVLDKRTFVAAGGFTTADRFAVTSFVRD